ncbi:MAG: hypothetical protein HWE25_08750 [Alphaproteobacteria bacterium]|nr:hypothetical protein [Alphaproteobacteria bacterium]
MKKTFALCSLLLSSLPSLGQEANPSLKNIQPKIYATAWGLTLADDGTGFYNDLARLIVFPERAKHRYDIIPYRRANRIFGSDKKSCHYPSSLNYMAATGLVDDRSDLIESYFFIRSVAHIFAPNGKEPPHDKEGTRGKIIAYPMGAEVPRLLQGYEGYFIPVADETDKASMLLGNRVELLIAYMPDARFVFDNLGADLPPYDPSFTINDDNIGVVCHKTPENEALIERINKRVLALRETGELAAFLEAAGIDPTYYLGALERKTLGH